MATLNRADLRTGIQTKAVSNRGWNTFQIIQVFLLMKLRRYRNLYLFSFAILDNRRY